MTQPNSAATLSPDNAYRNGAIMVIVCGLLWSTAGIGVRYVDAASGWHIVFFRSIGLVLTMLMVIAWRNKGSLVAPLKRTSRLSILAGLFMGASFFGNIFALLHTSVANVTFLLSASPFIAALLGWIILGERVKKRTWAAIALTSVGVSVMVGNELSGDGLVGMGFALMMAICYATFSVIMRRGKDNDMLPAALVAGLFSMTVAALSIDDFSISWNDLTICLALGFFQMGLAMALFITGSKHVPAAELTLLTMLEVILSPVWVWLAFNEHPGYWTLVGGSIIMLGVMVQAIGARRRHPQPQVF
ncbi:MAG: DMT family transporter [Gammaproteobacteria bacterium]|nr:DMT family transporter [Gammaproteobacteria bacterium]